jgi:hypothetical protein
VSGSAMYLRECTCIVGVGDSGAAQLCTTKERRVSLTVCARACVYETVAELVDGVDS